MAGLFYLDNFFFLVQVVCETEYCVITLPFLRHCCAPDSISSFIFYYYYNLYFIPCSVGVHVGLAFATYASQFKSGFVLAACLLIRCYVIEESVCIYFFVVHCATRRQYTKYNRIQSNRNELTEQQIKKKLSKTKNKKRTKIKTSTDNPIKRDRKRKNKIQKDIDTMHSSIRAK